MQMLNQEEAQGIGVALRYRQPNRVVPQARSYLPVQLWEDARSPQQLIPSPVSSKTQWAHTAGSRQHMLAIIIGLWLLVLFVAVAVGLRFIELLAPLGKEPNAALHEIHTYPSVTRAAPALSRIPYSFPDLLAQTSAPIAMTSTPQSALAPMDHSRSMDRTVTAETAPLNQDNVDPEIPKPVQVEAEVQQTPVQASKTEAQAATESLVLSIPSVVPSPIRRLATDGSPLEPSAELNNKTVQIRLATQGNPSSVQECNAATRAMQLCGQESR